MNPAIPISWQNQLVGRIEDPKPDNLRLYGRWRATDSETARQFADAVSNGERDVWITLGAGDAASRACVSSLGHDKQLSDTWIELAMIPEPNVA